MDHIYTLNHELSELIGRKYRTLFEPKRCCENVFRLMTHDILELPPLSSASALFCYACNVDDIYYRHAFCIFNGHIIEPLPHIAKGLRVERIIPIRDLKANEYFTHAVEDGRYDLFPSLLKSEISSFNAHPILATHLNPVDLGELVRTVANTIDDYHRIMSGIQAGQGLPGNTHI